MTRALQIDCKMQDCKMRPIRWTGDGQTVKQSAAAQQRECGEWAGEDTHGVVHVDFKSEAERDGETETTCTGTRTVGEPSVRGEGTLLKLP